MNKRLYGLVSVVILLLFAVSCVKEAAPVKPAEPMPVVQPNPPAVDTTAPVDTTGSTADSVVVEMTARGFSPKVVMVKAGQTVVFVNKDTADHRPASGPHPIHTGYPGSSAAKCGTAQQAETFDACAPIPPGSQYEFVFTHKGEWQFHDHLNPGTTGTLVVS